MISEQKIKEWVDLYLNHIEEITPEVHVREEEGYKFKSVDTFQQNFNIDSPNLAENLDEALENNNLVMGNMYFPKRVLIILASEYEEEVRKILKNLFNTREETSKRINEAEKNIEELVKKRNKERDENWEHTFIGLRFLSLLLAFRYPEQYNPIKPREWNMFCKFIDDNFSVPQGTASGEKYELFEKPINALRFEIKKIPEIKKLKDQLTRGLDFTDSEFRWMAQNIIYVAARIMAGKKSNERSQQKQRPVSIIGESENGLMEFPLEEYLENFIVKNWNGIDFGEYLSLYIDDEGTPAQQYPTSEGFIDLLAKDSDENFVVIELKKGRSNQQVVGQILSYVGWVKNNLADKNKKVRGIIVAADGNKALLDAVSTVNDFISVKYYRVKFNFEDPEER
jgi:hypothetical protein